MIVSVNSKDNPQRPSRASLEAIKGDAHRGEEVAIQCHPVQSRTIKRNQAHRGEEVAILHPVLSSAIQCNHAQSSAIKRTAARRLTMKGPI